MKNNSNEISNGAAFFMTMATMLIIAFIISIAKPECNYNGCDYDAMEDSDYCYLHKSDRYRSSKYTSGYTSSYSGSSTTTKSTTSNATTSSSDSKKSTAKSTAKSSKKTNPYKSYDEGYEAVYDDDDYDWDRYWSDSDYADGVDDAMEDCDW